VAKSPKQKAASGITEKINVTLHEKIERRRVADLKKYEQNAKKHPPAQVKELAALMREVGFTNPILIDEKDEIIAGHGRLEAADLNGMLDVPCIVLRGLTEAQKRAYRIADNKLGLLGVWDRNMLKLEMKGILELGGVDLKLTGFSTGELIGLGFGGTKGKTDGEATPALPAKPVTRRGDIWILGNHRLMCADATNAEEVARLLAGKKPTLMVTDPPYGVNYDPEWRATVGVNQNKKKMGKVQNDDRADWREAWALFPGDIAYVWHAGLFAATVQQSLEACDFAVRSQIMWAKDRFALSRGDYHWQHEPCWYAVRKGARGRWAGGRSQSTLWTIPAREDDGQGHGTQKPIECMKRPIENNSQPGDFIYEPFSGSGTTIIAGEQLNRSVLAIELDPAYVDVAVLRWQKFTGRKAKLEGAKGGSDYAKIASERG